MATPTFDEILALPTQAELMQQDVLPELVRQRVRVTDWIVGGIYRAAVFAISKLGVDVRGMIAAFTAANFEDWAFGFVEAPNGIDVTPWCTLVAKQRYSVDRIAATYTRRQILFTNSTARQYSSLNSGDIIISFPSGNRYVLDEDGVTIPANDEISLTFRSEFATDSTLGRVYGNDPSDATIGMVTANLPGVEATNPSSDFSDVTQIGPGFGVVTPTGVPNGDYTIAIRILATGQAGAASWAYSINGGAFSSPTTAASVVDAGSTGITITLTNGDAPASAFIQGSGYYFQAPGSDIIEVGRDIETPQALGTRCRGLYPSLAFPQDPATGNWIPISPTISGYVALALSASRQVVIAFVQTDGTINNKLLIYIAGQGAPLPIGVVATVQAFFDVWSMLTDLPVVATPASRTITLAAATVYVKSSMRAVTQSAMQIRLQKYFAGLDTNSVLTINGRVDHAYVASLIRTTPGVTRFDDTALTINGAAADLVLPVTSGAFEQAYWTQDVATDFSWVATS
jgi:hypothetical protein